MDSEIMGGIGFGNDEYPSSFHHHTFLSETSPDQESEKNFQRRIEKNNAQKVREYFSTGRRENLPFSWPQKERIARRHGVESFEPIKSDEVLGNITQFWNENTALLTLIFILVIIIVVMQIMHGRQVYKMVKMFSKHMREMHMRKQM